MLAALHRDCDGNRRANFCRAEQSSVSTECCRRRSAQRQVGAAYRVTSSVGSLGSSTFHLLAQDRQCPKCYDRHARKRTHTTHTTSRRLSDGSWKAGRCFCVVAASSGDWYTHAPQGQNGAFRAIDDRSMPPRAALALGSGLDFLRLLAAGAVSSGASLLSLLLLLSSSLPLSPLPLALELSSSSLKSSSDEDILACKSSCGPATSTAVAAERAFWTSSPIAGTRRIY